MGIYEREAYSVDVGTRLRQVREERSMSMRSLATASGLSANALSMIERGKTSPSVSTLYKLADAMGVPITTFFGEQTSKQQVIFLRAEERPRVSYSGGVREGLGGEQFSGRVDPSRKPTMNTNARTAVGPRRQAAVAATTNSPGTIVISSR
jgi:transcriptional regulator with XRE-family HTH domain